MASATLSSSPHSPLMRLLFLLWCCYWNLTPVSGFVVVGSPHQQHRSASLCSLSSCSARLDKSESSAVGSCFSTTSAQHQLNLRAVSFHSRSSRRGLDPAATTALFLSSSPRDADDEDREAADDGMNLAAEFLKMAKAKGIELQAEDLAEDDDDDDDDEEDEEDEKEVSGKTQLETRSQQQQSSQSDDDDDDDDEEEMNIPQGAINAFLGYDTGNVGEKLAGNVTLTNDQLYSEVKERVLESAGGFLDFVRGAEDDDDDDDLDDEDLVDEVLEITKVPSKKEYQPPLLVPDSDLTAGEVVITVLEALLHNDVPTPNRGVEILFGYSSPGSQIKNEVGLTPAEYADFLKDTEYKVLFDHQDVVRVFVCLFACLSLFHCRCRLTRWSLNVQQMHVANSQMLCDPPRSSHPC